jgi:hypothetical protein
MELDLDEQITGLLLFRERLKEVEPPPKGTEAGELIRSVAELMGFDVVNEFRTLC